METMNEKIKRLRKQKGLSQVEVAKAAGITQSSYASIEKGDTKSITIEVGKGFAKALGMAFNELFDIESDSQKIDDLNNQIKELNEKHKNIIESYTSERLMIKNIVLAVSDQNFKRSIVRIKYGYNGLEEDIKNLLMDILDETNKGFLRQLVTFGSFTQNDIKSFYEYMGEKLDDDFFKVNE